MERTPTVSILIPARNVEDYIKDSLKSVLAQTFNDWEAVIVVNGSTDSTLEIARNFEELDSRFIVVEIGAFSNGIVGALNFGINLCKGEYIARFDADDIMDVDRLEVQISEINKNYLDIVGVNVRYRAGENTWIPKLRLPFNPAIAKKIFPFRNPLLHSWLCSRKVYQSLEGYRSIPYAEDYDFIGRAIKLGFKVGSIASIHQTQIERVGNTLSTNYKEQVASQILVSRAFKNNILLDTTFDDYFAINHSKLIRSFDLLEKIASVINMPRFLLSKFHLHAYINAFVSRVIL